MSRRHTTISLRSPEKLGLLKLSGGIVVVDKSVYPYLMQNFILYEMIYDTVSVLQKP